MAVAGLLVGALLDAAQSKDILADLINVGIDEGYAITPEIIANFSPYRTEHLNRLDSYDVRFDQEPPPILEGLRLSPDLVVRAH